MYTLGATTYTRKICDSSEGLHQTSDVLYAHNIMAGNSRTFDQILGCKIRNEFDAQPVSALSAQIDSFSGVTLSTFEAVTGSND